MQLTKVFKLGVLRSIRRRLTKFCGAKFDPERSKNSRNKRIFGEAKDLKFSSPMKPYEIIAHTADAGVKANGSTLKELFENAAKGMFAIIGGKGSHKDKTTQRHKKIEIKKEVEGLEELLVDWLSELLYIFNKEEILFSDFRILELNNNGLVSEAKGNKIDPTRSALQTEIKAVTFHALKIEETRSGFSCNVIFDV